MNVMSKDHNLVEFSDNIISTKLDFPLVPSHDQIEQMSSFINNYNFEVDFLNYLEINAQNLCNQFL